MRKKPKTVDTCHRCCRQVPVQGLTKTGGKRLCAACCDRKPEERAKKGLEKGKV